MRRTNRLRLSLQQKRDIGGYVFVLPFTIGFVLFFLYPFIQSIMFSLSEVKLVQGGFELVYKGLDNYSYVFLKHGTFVRDLGETVLATLKSVPLILVFSFFAACLLNQKFRGRGVARAIFFLPVIMGAGAVLELEQVNYMMELAMAQAAGGTAGVGEILVPFMQSLRLPKFFIDYILYAIAEVVGVIRASGIQILIFLAGLQSVPASLYEAADVEGATGWERFWMITFPLVSPLILTSMVYTVIDSFTGSTNTVLTLVRTTILTGAGFGASAAMAWVYFATIGALLAVMMAIVSKRVFYQR
jgi:ABC-type sugar transport system permease subunit